jgi:hypothetical protein
MMAVIRERQETLLREAEQERLIAATRSQGAGRPAPFRRAAAWTGTHLVRWGRTLQEYGTTPSQEVTRQGRLSCPLGKPGSRPL